MPYNLPDSIYNSSQLRQLQSELTRLKSLRNPKNLTFSTNLQELAEFNKVKKLNLAVVAELQKFVNTALLNGAEITVNLACAPSVEERNELVSDLRRMFSKHLLIHFIIQPELLAGCTLRTKANFYDLSLRSALYDNKPKLIQRIRHA